MNFSISKIVTSSAKDNEADCLQDFLTWAVFCWGYEQTKKAFAEQDASNVILAETLEEFELHMLPNSASQKGIKEARKLSYCLISGQCFVIPTRQVYMFTK